MTESISISMSPRVTRAGPNSGAPRERAATVALRSVPAVRSVVVLRTVEELRTALAPVRRDGRTIGLVPTMGALHAGHRSLIERSRAECDVVVVSLFVNPSQFEERADLERYPREESRDRELAEQAGADILFAPAVEQVYPTGFATAVEVFGLTDKLEGAVRGASHFRGVTTVVTKLLNMVAPDVAYFGQKDAQQVVVVRRLVDDLNLPVRIETCATVREPDGLALSSRNARLSPEQRERAVALVRGLEAARAAVSAGERSAKALLARGRAAMAELGVEGGRVEYLELVDLTSLEPIEWLRGPALLAVAARIGETRLIDNFVLDPAALDATDERGALDATDERDTPGAERETRALPAGHSHERQTADLAG